MSGSNILQAANVAPQIVAGLQLSGTDEDVVYSVPADNSLIVKTVSLCNITNDVVLSPAGPVTALVSVAMVPASGTSDGTNRIISLFPLSAGDALPLGDYIGNAQLGPGDAVHAQSDTPGAVNIVVTGVLNS